MQVYTNVCPNPHPLIPISPPPPPPPTHPTPRSQWSWPINLPPQLFGIFPTGELVHNDTNTPWGDELEQKVLQSTVGIGPYVEVAFFDKRSKTLLVTDAVVCVPENPPPVRLLCIEGDGCVCGGGGEDSDVYVHCTNCVCMCMPVCIR